LKKNDALALALRRAAHLGHDNTVGDGPEKNTLGSDIPLKRNIDEIQAG
jgi:hypothetical protein